MARLRYPDDGRTVDEPAAIRDALVEFGVDHERWEPSHPLADDAEAATVLAAYGDEIERLKRSGGYVTADVIDVGPGTPGLDEMLARFNKEHWHDEDEVRFIIAGRGVFHLRSRAGAVVAVEVGPGDLLRVPRGTWHWFDLCEERRIRAIRLFQDPAGWTPHYTGSGVDTGYQPLCHGPAPVSGVSGVRWVLLDVEGTTTPIEFVTTRLFPFARLQMPAFLAAHGDDAEVEAAVAALRDERAADAADDLAPPEIAGDRPEAAAAYARWLIDRDRKSTPLKVLQGLIWREGYRSGTLRGEVFGDVCPALSRWRDTGLRAAIYSSGSVLAQKLLFAHSTDGDLSPYLSAHFDTTVGPKREAASYRAIADRLEVAPGEVLFASDVVAELDAARTAGMATRLARRPGNAAVEHRHGHGEITSLTELA